MSPRWAWTWLGWGLCASVQATSPPPDWQLLCEVSYLPARSTWVREVRIHWVNEQPVQMQIDQVQPHSFSVYDAQLLTAIDNERIALDLNNLTWHSDFRGVATGAGSCEVSQP